MIIISGSDKERNYFEEFKEYLRNHDSLLPLQDIFEDFFKKLDKSEGFISKFNESMKNYLNQPEKEKRDSIFKEIFMDTQKILVKGLSMSNWKSSEYYMNILRVIDLLFYRWKQKLNLELH